MSKISKNTLVKTGKTRVIKLRPDVKDPRFKAALEESNFDTDWFLKQCLREHLRKF